MRTLSRPMFNMGGPIKQGIMHGLREPKKHGGKMLLVGQHPKEFQDKSGREKHVAPVVYGVGAGLLHGARMALPWAARMGSRYIPKLKRIFGTTTPASVTRGTHRVGTATGSYSPVTMNPAKFNPNWLGRDPIVKGVGWAGKSIFSPTAGGLAAKALRFATAPSSIVGGVAWYLWPDGKERKTPPPQGKETGVPGGGDPGMFYEKPKKDNALTSAERDAFAKSQRNKRVEKYLELMGYDRSKKMAVADALIDASKIVSDRGTLDKKNITAELINPIIQATSKRFDKPGQIREAVGLMATKAEIEKDISAETDALAKTKTLKQIEALDRQLEEGVGIDLLTYIGSQKGKVKSEQLERVARLSANKHKLPFKKVTDEDMAAVGEGASEEEIIQSVVGDDGVYMVGDAIIEVKGGIPNRIV
jgi:hypothetical protein